jgi:hypothetical protein
MVSQRRRVAVASALSATTGGLVWVALLSAGLSAALATAVACGTVLGLASVAPWRVDRRLLGLSLVYAFAFTVLELPLVVFLLFALYPSGGE